MNFTELRKVHTQELQSFERTLKDAEAALSVSVCCFKTPYRMVYQFAHWFLFPCATTGTDSGADCREKRPIREASCRGEQEERTE